MMDRNSFWNIVEGSRKEAGSDDKACLKTLRKRLEKLTAYELIQYKEIFDIYHSLAYKAGLWEAAAVIEHGCSDDGFIDFRSWLISQGKGTYLAALHSPDSLAEMVLPKSCQFESYAYVPYKVYEEKFDKEMPSVEATISARALADIQAEIEYAPGIQEKHTGNAARSFLPCLIVKYYGEEALAAYDTTWLDPKEPLGSIEPVAALEPPLLPCERFAQEIREILPGFDDVAMKKLIDYARELDIDGSCEETEFFTKTCEELELAKQKYGEVIAQEVFNTATTVTLNYFEIPMVAEYFDLGYSKQAIVQSILDGKVPQREQPRVEMEMNM